MQLDRSTVVELDSSTPAKWSRHLVVRLAGRAFADNGHMGRFVEALLDGPEVASWPSSFHARMLTTLLKCNLRTMATWAASLRRCWMHWRLLLGSGLLQPLMQNIEGPTKQELEPWP